jgi:16S rRNA (uracil1498-N3)-methyltransferase
MGLRRVFIADLQPGRVILPADAAHHLTAVLRLEAGTRVLAFNRTGAVADAELLSEDGQWALDVGDIRVAAEKKTLVVASAVPKGDRADWLVEKLAELGVSRWVPLRTERSVVHPEGTGKTSRWERIAVEAAKQSHSAGVLEIGSLTELKALLKDLAGKSVWVCSTGEGAIPAGEAESPDVIVIGPEGGWSAEEEVMMTAAGATRVTLGATVLRVETACMAAAVVARLSRG